MFAPDAHLHLSLASKMGENNVQVYLQRSDGEEGWCKPKEEASSDKLHLRFRRSIKGKKAERQIEQRPSHQSQPTGLHRRRHHVHLLEYLVTACHARAAVRWAVKSQTTELVLHQGGVAVSDGRHPAYPSQEGRDQARIGEQTAKKHEDDLTHRRQDQSELYVGYGRADE